MFARVLIPLLLTTSLAIAQAPVDLNVVVTPKSGPPVADLQQADFTVLDNKIAQPIQSFRASGKQDAVHIIVVLDAVNVNFSRLGYVRSEVERFLRANSGELARPTQLAYFTDTGVKIQEGFSTNGNELNDSLRQQDIGLREIRRSSQFEALDRFQLSITALRSLVAHESELPGRKMIVWISPGWPLLSGPRVQLDSKQQNLLYGNIVDVSAKMRQGQVTLYNVNPLGTGEGIGQEYYFENFVKGVTRPQQTEFGDLSLQVLAVQSGGLALFGNNDTSGLLEKCVDDARASYQLSYQPKAAEHPNEYHQIEVQLSKPGLTARTRQGYYAQP